MVKNNEQFTAEVENVERNALEVDEKAESHIDDSQIEALKNDVTKEVEDIIDSGDSMRKNIDNLSGLNGDDLQEIKEGAGLQQKMQIVKQEMINLVTEFKDNLKNFLQKEEKVFDPEEELANVRKSSKEDRNDKLREFGEKYLYQKRGTAIIQENIINQIKKNPKLSTEEILNRNEKQFAKFGLTELQRDHFAKILNRYEDKHESIKSFTEQFANTEEMFEAIFNQKPKGEVALVMGPTSIGFKCSDPEDFAKAADPSENMDFGSTSDGVRFSDVGIAGLEGSVILINENLIKSDNGNIASVIEHEQQHTINSLFYEEVYDRGKLDDMYDDATTEKDEQNKELLLNRYLREVRHLTEQRVADELIAMYKEYSNPSIVKELMLKSAEDGGAYDYFKNVKSGRKKQLVESMGVENEELIDNSLIEIFEKEYAKLISDAVDAIYHIPTSRKASKDFVIANFQNESLRKWSKVSNRIDKFYNPNTKL